MPGAAGSATHVVAQDGSGDFSTIGAAISAAAPGDAIMVIPDTYAESLVIDKDVTLRGEGDREAVVIDPTTASANTVTFPAHTISGAEVDLPVGIRIEGSSATLAGFSILVPDPGVGVHITGGAPVIEDVSVSLATPLTAEPSDSRAAFWLVEAAEPTIRDSAWDGYFAVREGSAPTIEGNTITGHVVSVDGLGETTLARNRFLDGASTSASEGAVGVIEDNEFDGGNIAIDTGSDMLVPRNAIRDFQGGVSEAAIVVRDVGTRGRVLESTVTGSSSGISIGFGADVIVSGNRIEDTDVGIALGVSEALVEGNTIAGSSRAGLTVAGGFSPRIKGNAITGSERGPSLGTGSAPELTGKTFCGNQVSLFVLGENPMTLGGQRGLP